MFAIRRLSCCLALALAACARNDAATRRFESLVEYWRWNNYWAGTTYLGQKYVPGRSVRLLMFWHDREPPDGNDQWAWSLIGFCSEDLNVCQAYPNVTTALPTGEMEIGGLNSRAAFQKFVNEKLHNGDGIPRERSLTIDEFATQEISVVLPNLDPPRPIRNREERVKLNEEVQDLLKPLGCQGPSGITKPHLLIPYYGDTDPAIFVYRECGPEVEPPRVSVAVTRREEGIWYVSAMSLIRDENEVRRLRKLIEGALMIEVAP